MFLKCYNQKVFMDSANNYLSVLLNDIEQLKNHLASFNNVLLNLQSKYGIIDDDNKLGKSLSEQEKNVLLQTIAMFRAYATRTVIGFNSVKTKFASLEEDKLQRILKNYSIVTSTSIPDYEISSILVQDLSDIFVAEINIQSLINSSNKTQTLAESSVTPNYEE